MKVIRIQPDECVALCLVHFSPMECQPQDCSCNHSFSNQAKHKSVMTQGLHCQLFHVNTFECLPVMYDFQNIRNEIKMQNTESLVLNVCE